MKIAVFSDSWFPYISGVVYSISIFREELQKQGHEVFIFAPAYKGQKPEEGVFRFPAIPAPTNAEFALALPFSYRVGRLLKELEIDIVHCHSPFLLGGLGARWARKLGIPLVFTHHTLYDLYTHYVPLIPGLAKKLVRRFVCNFCDKCDLVITPTQVVADRLTRFGVTAPLRAIPTGVPLWQYQDTDPHWLKNQFAMPEEAQIVLCVARLGPEKNIEMLLESFEHIHREKPQTHLVLVGLGPLRKQLAKRVENSGLTRRVHFLDRILTRQEIANCYSGADLFLFASVTETQGMIVNEAHACGLPVVAVSAYGVAEMVRHGEDGYLTEPNALDLAKTALMVLKSQNLRVRLRDNAYLSAQAIAADLMAQELASTYQELLTGKVAFRSPATLEYTK